MNDLKEIGGFIVSADPYVNHDNSLSGNGTLTSPLGVVPGYNETVLFDSYGSGTSAATLSESMANFERIRLLLGNQNSVDGVEWHEYIADPDKIKNIWYCAGGGSNFYFICLYCSANTNTNITVNKEAAIFKGFGNTSVNGQSEQAAYKNCIHKVIGINRKQ